MILRKPSRQLALVIAMAALVLGGLSQELLLLGGYPGLGAATSVSVAILVAWLWRPSRVILGIIGLGLGIELLLPLQTGGGRFQDWVLHYQTALHYAGRPSQVLANALRWRTPLFHQLSAGILASSPGYWTFQVESVLLSSLWLWPASLLIHERAPDSTALRLLAVALAPIVIAYTTFTWPWNVATFFLLAALWLENRPDLVARVGFGIALGGALLSHPGTIGFVLGLGLAWMWRHRSAALAGAVAMALVLVSGLPWVAAVSGSAGPQALVTGSLPAQVGASPGLWLLSRVILVAHTFAPTPIPTPDRFWASLALTFFVLSLPGALVTALVAARLPRPSGALLASLGVGALTSLAIYPGSNYMPGMLDSLYPGVVMFLTFAAASLDPPGARRMLGASLVLGAVFIVLLMLLSTFPLTDDSNVTYRSQYSAIFFVQRWGVLPGLVTLAAAAAALAGPIRAGFRWRRLEAAPG